jgi:hypothetical protein
MNHIGARAQAGFAGSIMLESMPAPDYIINSPFMVWFEVDSEPQPVFSAFVAEESWADPGSIE